VIDGLEALKVEMLGLSQVEGYPQYHEGLVQSLDTNTNGPAAHIALVSLGNRVVVDVNGMVEVEGDDFGDIVKFWKSYSP
jgi:hypothetical protein